MHTSAPWQCHTSPENQPTRTRVPGDMSFGSSPANVREMSLLAAPWLKSMSRQEREGEEKKVRNGCVDIVLFRPRRPRHRRLRPQISRLEWAMYIPLFPLHNHISIVGEARSESQTERKDEATDEI